jgi:nicotinate phosphoribosyltransferase
MPVEKRSSLKESHGGRKQALRTCKPTGTTVEEIVYQYAQPPRDEPGRLLTVDLVRDGEPVGDLSIDAARKRVKEGLHSLPWDGLKLSKGEPAVPTRMIPPSR